MKLGLGPGFSGGSKYSVTPGGCYGALALGMEIFFALPPSESA